MPLLIQDTETGQYFKSGTDEIVFTPDQIQTFAMAAGMWNEAAGRKALIHPNPALIETMGDCDNVMNAIEAMRFGADQLETGLKKIAALVLS